VHRRLSLFFAVPLLAVSLAACGDPANEPPVAVTEPSRASAEPPDGEPAPEGIAGVIAVTGLSNEHSEDAIDYPNYPPLGGDHYPAWVNCGFYDHAIPDEPAVHSLEHGAVWIAYSPDIADEQRQAIRDRVLTDGHLLASEYPGLRSPIVLTAWGRQLDLDTIDDPRVQQFLDAYLRAGDAPEPGTTCAGGIDP
jgi:hypothetical protein